MVKRQTRQLEKLVSFGRWRFDSSRRHQRPATPVAGDTNGPWRNGIRRRFKSVRGNPLVGSTPTGPTILPGTQHGRCSSPVEREFEELKAAGSIPAPAASMGVWPSGNGTWL